MFRNFLLSVFFSTGIFSNAKANHIQKHLEKIIIITVNKNGQAIIGKDTFSTDGLTTELKQRLWRSFTGTGKMQDSLKLQFNGNVSSMIQHTMLTAIQKAQQNVLIDLSLQLHKKRFEELSDRQQDKIKRQYPILFQQKF